MNSRGPGAVRIGATLVIPILGLLAGAGAFLATRGVVEAITAAAIVVAVASFGLRLVRSIG